MNDDRLELAIHAALKAREPGPVPPSLRARVATIPADSRTRRWPSPAGVLRGGLRLAAVTAAVALLVAITDYGLDRMTSGPGTIPAPAVDRVPFVVDGAGLFSAEAVADADRRLEAVFRATGIEATLLTQHEAADNQLSTPPGFPDRYDRDGRDGRDIVEVVGVDPSGTVSCCMTVNGPLLVSAMENGSWPPMTRAVNLTAMFTSEDLDERAAGLDRFVDGVEVLSGRIEEVGESVRTGEAWRTGIVGGFLGAVLLVTWWLVRPRSGLVPRRFPDRGADVGAEVEDLPVRGGPQLNDVQVEEAAARRRASMAVRRAGPTELLLAGASAAAFGAFLVTGLDLALANPPARPLDLSMVGFGLAPFQPPVLALAFLVASVALLMVLAARVGRAGWGILSLVIVGILALAGAIVGQQPVLGSGATSGLGFEHRESGGPQGIFELDYYPVGVGEPFTLAITVRNPGPLPMTILGLSETFTKPGPGYVPGLEIVGLGTRNGPVLRGAPDGAEEFEPVRLGAGEEVQLIVVGRGGTCAAGSLGTMEGFALATHVPIAYRVLGATRIVEIGLPSTVAVPTLVQSCNP